MAGAAAVLLAEAAAASPRVTLDWSFGTDAPGTTTSAHVRLGYRDGDAEKAPGLDGLVLRAPRGARFDPGGRPRCAADDVALRLLGRDACPAGSRVGGGWITVDTGLGGPVDPVRLDLHAYATPAGMVELVQAPGTNLTLGLDRLDIAGDTLTAHPPRTPGGPPDWRTNVRDIDLRLDGRGFVRTPPACATGRWTAAATAMIAGALRTAVDELPCRRPAVAARRRDCRRVGPRRTGQAGGHERPRRCRSGGPRRGLAGRGAVAQPAG